MGEVVLGVEGWAEPVAKPPDHFCRAEYKAVQGKVGLRGWGTRAWGPLVDEFCLGG